MTMGAPPEASEVVDVVDVVAAALEPAALEAPVAAALSVVSVLPPQPAKSAAPQSRSGKKIGDRACIGCGVSKQRGAPKTSEAKCFISKTGLFWCRTI